ncbi:EamA family transporter [Paenalcaligenes hominis]|uniref:EamA family transporter n=1 Tax=Paenalcaligenes hominis TaxID=643674 RepID=UPI0035255FFD
MTPAQPFSRRVALFILLSVGTCFASAHIAARISFDNGTGLLTAVVFRSIVTLGLLSLLAVVYKQSIKLSWRLVPWQLLLGLLIAIQSISIYSAVSRIPVGIALLTVNTFPVQLALISWLLGGKPPTKARASIMGLILIGLILALDIPALAQSDQSNIDLWLIGIGFALFAAFSFALGLWVTENKLSRVQGSARSFYTMLTVLCLTLSAGSVDIIPGGLSLPETGVGLATLLLLSGLYACAFIMLFMLAPRLNLAQNASAMNIEPVASLTLGWLILGQALSPMQMVGGAVVVSCIVAFAQLKK